MGKLVYIFAVPLRSKAAYTELSVARPVRHRHTVAAPLSVFYRIWRYDPSGAVFRSIFIPEAIYTNISGVIFYWLTGLITRGFGTVTEHYIEEKSDDIVRE